MCLVWRCGRLLVQLHRLGREHDHLRVPGHGGGARVQPRRDKAYGCRWETPLRAGSSSHGADLDEGAGPALLQLASQLAVPHPPPRRQGQTDLRAGRISWRLRRWATRHGAPANGDSRNALASVASLQANNAGGSRLAASKGDAGPPTITAPQSPTSPLSHQHSWSRRVWHSLPPLGSNWCRLQP